MGTIKSIAEKYAVAILVAATMAITGLVREVYLSYVSLPSQMAETMEALDLVTGKVIEAHELLYLASEQHYQDSIIAEGYVRQVDSLVKIVIENRTLINMLELNHK